VAEGADTLFGATTFFLGHDEYAKTTKEVKFIMEYHLDNYAKKQGKEKFDAADYPVIAFFIMNYCLLCIQDPLVIQDMMTTKN